MKIGDLVIGAKRDPGNVVFKIVGTKKGGWLACDVYCEQNGKLIRPFNAPFKFRTSEVVMHIPSSNYQEVAQ